MSTFLHVRFAFLEKQRSVLEPKSPKGEREEEGRGQEGRGPSSGKGKL